jgi:hypothetical protein
MCVRRSGKQTVPFMITIPVFWLSNFTQGPIAHWDHDISYDFEDVTFQELGNKQQTFLRPVLRCIMSDGNSLWRMGYIRYVPPPDSLIGTTVYDTQTSLPTEFRNSNELNTFVTPPPDLPPMPADKDAFFNEYQTGSSSFGGRTADVRHQSTIIVPGDTLPTFSIVAFGIENSGRHFAGVNYSEHRRIQYATMGYGPMAFRNSGGAFDIRARYINRSTLRIEFIHAFRQQYIDGAILDDGRVWFDIDVNGQVTSHPVSYSVVREDSFPLRFADWSLNWHESFDRDYYGILDVDVPIPTPYIKFRAYCALGALADWVDVWMVPAPKIVPLLPIPASTHTFDVTPTWTASPVATFRFVGTALGTGITPNPIVFDVTQSESYYTYDFSDMDLPEGTIINVRVTVTTINGCADIALINAFITSGAQFGIAILPDGTWFSAVREGNFMRIRRFERDSGAGELGALLGNMAEPSLFLFTGTTTIGLMAQDKNDKFWKVWRSNDEAASFQLMAQTPFDSTFSKAVPCGMAEGGVYAIAIKTGTTPLQAWGAIAWDGVDWEAPVLIGSLGASTAKTVRVEQEHAADSSRLKASNGVDWHRYSDNYGETWQVSPGSVY